MMASLDFDVNGSRQTYLHVPKDHNRIINYLRLSITDRCNLRCIYCMPEEGIHFKPHSEILTYEEMLRIVKLCVRSGIRKVRLTGGEPLVRKGILSFIEKLCEIEHLKEVALTTNGVLLEDTILKKPKDHGLALHKQYRKCARPMNGIGG